jgi:hypothetical protein
VKKQPNWAHGFSIIRVLPDGTYFANQVHIIDYSCMFDGTIFRG